MAPIASTVALSHAEGVSDTARARELYKYYQPSAPVNADTCFPPTDSSNTESTDEENPRNIPIQSDITSSKVSSPDTALTAFCQLVTWRTGAQRAMIGLIDAETQYFVAESTKTVDFVDTAKHAPGDDIWMGCSSVSKAGKLCERTIAVAPTKAGGDYPAFIVDDLSKDERFNQLPFVTGSPNLRFYAGVPLITKRGIAIGSLFIVDDRVRHGLEKEHIHFMGTMAKTIMKHMEMVREVEEHRRGMKMSRGLASFVEGRAELVEADIDAEDGEGTRVAGQFETDSGISRTKSRSSHSHSHRGSTASTVASGSVTSTERKEREYSASLAKTEEILRDVHEKTDNLSPRPDITSGSQATSYISLGGTSTTATISPPTDKTGVSPASDTSEESSQKILCSRAANLIRETFEVDGGCVFYDAQGGFSDQRERARHSELSNQDDTQDSATEVESQFNSGDELHPGDTRHDNTPAIPILQSQDISPSPLGEASYSKTSIISKKPVDILGFSTPGASSIHADELPGHETFRPVDERDLNTLLRRFPRGKLWTFDSDGGISSSSEEELFRPVPRDPTQRRKDAQRRKMKSTKAKNDAKFLAKHFPGVRQLLFVPLWDAGRSRWLSGCFVWSTELTRVLSKQSELSFLTAFGNSVMAEWSRIDTEIASQKKGDFIGSISHELRSPLHGILASAEFLYDEVESTFEKGLVETISSCGRTLLDTINHVLDFSKINNFERTWQKNKRRGNRSNSAVIKSDMPMINLFQPLDISVACEEVVEGVFAGHIFQNGTAANFDMVGGARDKTSHTRSPTQIEPFLATSTLQQPEVALIFDAEVRDYQFTTQPGAFRRVVMNLLGNALKYTSHGYVRLKLTSEAMDDYQDPETGEVIPRVMVELNVTDTGKGISPEFIRSKLFTPFAQENSLSSGTGLGLAIVRSIVNILEGNITIDSVVGKGTNVKITLPLLRELPKHPESGSIDTPKSISSAPESDETISKLRSRVHGKTVSLHGFDATSPDPLVDKMTRLLKTSVKNYIVDWYGMEVIPMEENANIIISNEATSGTISELLARYGKRPPSVVVLCSQTSRSERMSADGNTKSNIGYVAKPVGPLKLGKAIAQCLEGVQVTTPNVLEGSPLENDLSNMFEEMSSNPKRGEVLDNSRMAADSDNARKALESPTPNALMEKGAEFPFPVAGSDDRKITKRKSMNAGDHTPNAPTSLRVSETIIHAPSSSSFVQPTRPLSLNITPTPSKRAPSFLLVDDNAINLTLLSTSISKRTNSAIDTAMDGLAAVKKFEEREEGYDIVFMDISMPLLDGFGATMEIRRIEGHRRDAAASAAGRTSSNPAGAITRGITRTGTGGGKGDAGKGKGGALVIALTGLASSDDQARAAAVGVDLFLTKPVSFKEVKKILDNWEANWGKESPS